MILAVGFFDGVHIGHQAILAGADAALTFRDHPRRLIAPGGQPRLIMTLEERLDAIAALGVVRISALEFDRRLMTMTPAEFIRSELLPLAGGETLTVRCGENWRFGAGGAGDAETLRRAGIQVDAVPLAQWQGAAVSSTRIRECLADGEVEAAAAMLGRPLRLAGTVVSGKGLGRDMGRPTVNVLTAGFGGLLRRGVYLVDALGERAVANWGMAPTCGDAAWKNCVLEVHFPGVVPDRLPAAGEKMEVRLRHFLRPERKFGSMDELAAAIEGDCRACLASANGGIRER